MNEMSFRPLSGNLIFQSYLRSRAKNKAWYTFPSPIGESYFSIKNNKGGKYNEEIVSVPYRGILFFNTLSHTCLFLRVAKALCVGKRFFMEFLVFIRVQYPRKP